MRFASLLSRRSPRWPAARVFFTAAFAPAVFLTVLFRTGFFAASPGRFFMRGAPA
jgi:hypothetical protein